MDTNTAITTAARRITRKVNATPREVTVAFDADGEQVDAHSTGLSYIDLADEPAYAVKAEGQRNARTRMTHRDAQDLLDAAVHAAQHPGDPWAASEYLQHLAQARASMADAR